MDKKIVMQTNICVSLDLRQKIDEEVNEILSVQEVKKQSWVSAEMTPDNALLYMSQKSISQEEFISNLKHGTYRNIVQGIGKSLAEARNHWNHLYFLDYDISKWTSGVQGMKDCIKELQNAFPNHLIIKPSNRFGIHIVLASDSPIYNGSEHVYYGIRAYRIIKKYNPIFKEKDICKQVMDGSFFNNFNQRMNLNVLTFLGKDCYLTSDFATFNFNPEPFPKTIIGFDDFIDELTEEEKQVVNFYSNKMFGSRQGLRTEKQDIKPIVCTGNQFNMDKNFGIPGVPYTGNDLRWRMVSILYSKKGYEDTKSIIAQKFVQVPEMLASLETIHRSRSVKYQVKNYLIEKFIDTYILDHKASPIANTSSIYMSQAEFLSDHLDMIEKTLHQSSVYIVSPPNTGKTELMKRLFHRLDKCVILVHQNSILSSKFESDPALSPFIIHTKDIKKMWPAPNKIICIWDTFEVMARKRDLSKHYLLLDETHNFIAQFGFRKVIIDVLQSLNSEHQLWMTGTPCNEEVLMPNHTRLDCHKQSQTQYNVYPIQVDTTKHREYISYVCSLIDVLRTQCVTSSNKLISIYDNRDHTIWQEKYGNDSAHYVSAYKDSTDVAEINLTAKTSKSLVNSTSFLGEGVDIKGYDEVYAIIPVNLFVSELNVLQFVKRFRDARVVHIYLIQYVRFFDFRMPYTEADLQALRDYVQGFCYQNVRNPEHDRTLMIQHLELRHLILIATNMKFQNLYDAFFRFMSAPFNIYMAHYLRPKYSFNVQPITFEKPVETEMQVPSRENPVLREYVSKNYERLAHTIEESDGYDEVIYQVEEELGNGEVPFRTELRNILVVIRKANEMHCLRDCVMYFCKRDGTIQWKKIDFFLDDIQLKLDLLDGKKSLDSNIESCRISGKERMKTVERSVDLLNFQLHKGESIAKQVDGYRDMVHRGKSKFELDADVFFSRGFVSVFKPKKYNTMKKTKAVVIKDLKTGMVYKFESQKECQAFLSISKPTFKAFSKGSSKLNEKWLLVGSGADSSQNFTYQ